MKQRKIYALAIYDCIQRINEYIDGYDVDAFIKDYKTQDAVVRNLEIIGQAVKDYGVDHLTDHAPNVPWSQVAGMRNIIAHEYLGVDMVIVWETVKQASASTGKCSYRTHAQ